MPRTTDLPKAVIVAAYNAGATVQQLADTYGRDFSTMRANLHRWGASVRRTGPARTYSLNEDYFSSIETEEQAYWLGFLLADGCVQQFSPGNWALRVQLAERDGGHLHKLREALESDAEVRGTATRGHTAKSVQFCSRRLCDDLTALECGPRKTGRHGTPAVRSQLLRHVYRGYFDGNGSIASHRVSQWLLTMVGPPAFIREFVNWVTKKAGLVPSYERTSGPVLDVRYGGGRRAEAVLGLLYEGATVYLERKHEIYLALKSRNTRPGPRPNPGAGRTARR